MPASRRRIWPLDAVRRLRHRLRVCFTAFIASQRTGMTPLILLARPIPAGERVWIWLRPGLALADLEARLDRLAAGCWAAECRIAPASRRYSALLRLDIARRNPLTRPGRLTACPTWSPPPSCGPNRVDTRTRTAGLDLPDIPEPAPQAGTAQRTPAAQGRHRHTGHGRAGRRRHAHPAAGGRTTCPTGSDRHLTVPGGSCQRPSSTGPTRERT